MADLNQALGITSRRTSADVAHDAAGIQADQGQQSLELQKQVYAKQQEDFSPYLQAGGGALSRLQTMDQGQGFGADPEYQKYLAEMRDMTTGEGLSGSKIYEDPIYKFQQEEANRGLSRKLRSLGRENSTYGMNAVGRQSNQLAADQYNNINNTRFSRLSGLASTRYATLADQYNRLRDLAGSGQAAAGMQSNAGANYASGAGATLSNMGNNMASSTLAGGLMNAGATQNNANNLTGLAKLGMSIYDRYKTGSSGSSGDDSGLYNSGNDATWQGDTYTANNGDQLWD